jgi:hypothetical protein
MSRNVGIFSSIPLMVDTVAEFNETLTDIDKVATDRMEVAVPALTMEKRKAEAAMIDRVVPIANALYVTGFIKGNTDLLSLQGLSDSSFYRLTDSNKLPLARRILQLAQQYADDLANAGYDEAKIAETEAAIENYSKVIVNPMNAITVRKQKTTNIKELFARLDSILYDKLDKLMLLFKASHPDFYGEYRTSRNVIDLTGKKVAEE